MKKMDAHDNICNLLAYCTEGKLVELLSHLALVVTKNGAVPNQSFNVRSVFMLLDTETNAPGIGNAFAP